MNKIPITSCICQECNHHFEVFKDIVTLIEIDKDTEILPLLFNNELNKITCPYCNKSFTYETQILIYSQSRSYAIYVNPKNYISNTTKSSRAMAFFMPDDFKYREVTFLIEGIEKVLIFNDGYSDLYIEYLKYTYFNDYVSQPNIKYNIVYSHTYNNKLCFLRYNSTNDILSGYIISDILNYKPINIINKFSDNNSWLKVNRQTIKECMI